MTDNYESIRVHVTDGVATLTLHRPDRLNSFTVAMHGEVRAALDSIASDRSIRCFVLTGSGRGFCAGQDLSDRAVAPDAEGVDLGASIEHYYKPLLQRLRDLPMPTIAAVNGVAAGAGANIPFACDLVYAAQSASFIQSFSKLGLVPDCGGTWWLPRLAGPARAMGLALLGEKLPAKRSVAIGPRVALRSRWPDQIGTLVTIGARAHPDGERYGFLRHQRSAVSDDFAVSI